MPDFTVPDPNDPRTREARNQRLAARLATTNDDIVEMYLQTAANGSTAWVVVLRDGTTRIIRNP